MGRAGWGGSGWGAGMGALPAIFGFLRLLLVDVCAAMFTDIEHWFVLGVSGDRGCVCVCVGGGEGGYSAYQRLHFKKFIFNIRSIVPLTRIYACFWRTRICIITLFSYTSTPKP